MRELLPAFANNLWYAACIPAWRRFRRAATNMEQAQVCILRRYLSANQNTEYGRRFDFASVASVESFQKSIPITTYEDYLEPVEAIGQGRPNVLTAEPVIMFEITSGSSSASKLIPYTRSLRSEFRQAVAVWIVDLFRHNPDLKGGPAYWSITPLVGERRTTPGGIPIGFEEDSAYLGPWAKRLMDAALAVPNCVKSIRDMDTFRYATLLFLIRQRHLRLISIWNPTFLSLLLASLSRWWEVLIKDVANGILSPPDSLDTGWQQALLHQLSPDPRRARVLARIQPEDYRAIWPHLGLISCWTDGPAAPYAEALRNRFSNVLFQSKGLIATEAFVSFPVTGVDGNALAVTSHFFEFLPADSQTCSPRSVQPRLAHQLERGQAYVVVVTTGGGLYRYCLHDVVRVVDYLDQVPCLRFLGKEDQTSDWFGEKLHERFVADVLESLFSQYGLSPGFAMLAPDDSQEGFHYTLYLEASPDQRFGDDLVGLASDLDQRLRQSFHYNYCRELGQLAAPEIFWCAQGASRAYLHACRARGQRLGNIKPSSLQKTTGWRDHFAADERTGHKWA